MNAVAYIADLVVFNIFGPAVFFGCGWVVVRAGEAARKVARGRRLIALSREVAVNGRPV